MQKQACQSYRRIRRQQISPKEANPIRAAAVGSGTTEAEKLKSSTANPWSLPESSMSSQRIKIESPGFKVTPVKTVGPKTVLFAAAFPSRVAAVAPVVGDRKSRVGREVKQYQPVFAALLNVPLATARSWEQGKRKPSGAALRLLDLARQRPKILLAA